MSFFSQTMRHLIFFSANLCTMFESRCVCVCLNVLNHIVMACSAACALDSLVRSGRTLIADILEAISKL